jgi:hypothetical protein
MFFFKLTIMLRFLNYRAAKQTKSCFNACPNSQLKDVAIADYYTDEVACEPDKNFGGYESKYLIIIMTCTT